MVIIHQRHSRHNAESVDAGFRFEQWPTQGRTAYTAHDFTPRNASSTQARLSRESSMIRLVIVALAIGYFIVTLGVGE
jgi:hypothetical protein